MFPADQRFVADDALLPGGDDRLIGDVELVLRERVAQIVFERLAVLRPDEQFRAVEAVDAAPVGLGGVEREIGVADQAFRILAVLGGDRDADRARSEEHTSELQSLMRISYAVFCLTNKK